MKRLLVLIAFIALLGAFVLSNISDTSASTADASIPDNEVSSSLSEADASDSASATITIRVTTAPLPDE